MGNAIQVKWFNRNQIISTCDLDQVSYWGFATGIELAIYETEMHRAYRVDGNHFRSARTVEIFIDIRISQGNRTTSTILGDGNEIVPGRRNRIF